MDQALRELERRCETSPGEATLWARLARARLRAGLRPAEALAAIRSGLRANPASEDVARARDDVLAEFWKAPAFRRLWQREGTTGERVIFSHDGSLVAVVSPGVVVFKVDENEIAGAGLAGQAFYSTVFLGEDVLVAQDRRLSLFSARTGHVRRMPVEYPSALASARDGSRAVVLLGGSTVLRLVLEHGKLRATDETSLPQLSPFPGGARAGSTPELDEVVIIQQPYMIASFSGARFETETKIAEGRFVCREELLVSQQHVVAEDGHLQVFYRNGKRPQFFSGHGAAITPDDRVLVTPTAEGPRWVRFDEFFHWFSDLSYLCKERASVVACSLCGSRLALLASGLTIMEAC